MSTQKPEYSAASPVLNWVDHFGEELTTQVAEKENLRHGVSGKFAWLAAESTKHR